MGFILTLTNYAHLVCLMIFFVSSSLATKFRSHKKRKIEADFKEGGQRNWIQVLCNGGMASQLALLYLLDVGCGERPIDFYKDYRSSWLSIGILGKIILSIYFYLHQNNKKISIVFFIFNDFNLGAFSCCNGDTWASEFGAAIGNSDPFLITTRKRVPRGDY